MIEVINTYSIFLLAYPLVFFFYVFEMQMYDYLAIWSVIGIVVSFILYKYNMKKWLLYWSAIWFMPATVICGAGTVIPWIISLYWGMYSDNCQDWFSLSFSLVINIFLVYILRSLYRKYGLGLIIGCVLLVTTSTTALWFA